MKLSMMTEIEAKEICGWEYEEEYSSYNYSKEQGWAITETDRREKEFFSAYKNEKLVGYIRLTSTQGLAVLGIGLEPELCGQGIGKDVMNLGVLKAKELYSDHRVVLMVKQFNTRAVKCYQKTGFKIINDKFVLDNERYLVMEYK